MTLTEYTAAVNDILREESRITNEKQAKGEILFGSEHYDYPERMLQLYFDQGLTPEQAIAEINDESEAEGRWEASAS